MNEKVKNMRDAFLSTIQEKAEMLGDSDQCIFYSTCLGFLDAMLYDKVDRFRSEPVETVEEPLPKPVKKTAHKSTKTAKKAVVAEVEVVEEVPAEPVSPKIEEVVEEAFDKVDTPESIPLPKDDETDEEIFARRGAFCAVYGNKTLGEVFEDEKLMAYLQPEFSQVNDLTDIVFEHYKDVCEDFNDRDQAVEVVNYYIASVDDGIEDFTQLTVDKFLNVFHPFMAQMYYILQFSEDQVVEAMTQMSNGTLGKNGSAEDLDYLNSEAVAAILAEMYPETK